MNHEIQFLAVEIRNCRRKLGRHGVVHPLALVGRVGILRVCDRADAELRLVRG
jgi:hypothetical protein